MKKFTFLSLTLFVLVVNTIAQIPNNGFEQWDNIGSFMEPVGYLTPNSEAIGTYYPVTRSTDHYPTTVGDYSIRIENNTSLLPNIDGLGIALQNTSNILFDGPGPAFPIIGHPTSLTGYFKYSPQNGDSMFILVLLYHNGTVVAGNEFVSADTTLNWSPFTLPFSNYVTADSGSILIAAYYANGHPPQYVPFGNSVLHIDNLNFDNLITSIPEQTTKNHLFSFYPNPAFDYITLNTDETANGENTVNIYNIIGELVMTKKRIQNQQKINIDDLISGVYLVEIRSNDLFEKQKLIVQR